MVILIKEIDYWLYGKVKMVIILPPMMLRKITLMLTIRLNMEILKEFGHMSISVIVHLRRRPLDSLSMMRKLLSKSLWQLLMRNPLI